MPKRPHLSVAACYTLDFPCSAEGSAAHDPLCSACYACCAAPADIMALKCKDTTAGEVLNFSLEEYADLQPFLPAITCVSGSPFRSWLLSELPKNMSNVLDCG
jgi:hypothetical protein